MKFRIVFLCALNLYAIEPFSENEEHLFFQRIERAYYQADDTSFFSHVHKYIQMYPDTQNLDKLHALSVSVFYRNRNYQRAVQIYDMIGSKELQKTVRFYYLSSQFELGNYEKVIAQITKRHRLAEREEDLLSKSFQKIIFDKLRDNQERYTCIQRAISFYEPICSKAAHFKNLAEYYFMLQKFSKSAAVLRRAALLELDANNKEEILWQLSNVQAYFCQDQAIKTLNQVLSMQGSLQSIAAYNRLVLSLKNNRYQEIIQEKELYRRVLQDRHAPFFCYALGLSYAWKEEFTQAENELLTFLTNKKEYEFLEEDALSCLQAITNKKNGLNVNCTTEKRSSEQNLTIFVPQEHRKLELFTLSRAYENDEIYKLKEQQKKELITSAENIEEKMLSHFELAVFYFDKKNYKKARDSFREFIKKYSGCSLRTLAWDYLLQSSKYLSQNDHDFAKAKLIYDLEEFLNENGEKITQTEFFKYKLLLATTQYETNAFEEAIETVEGMIEQNPPKKVLSKCLAIMAYSYRFGFQDQQKFSTIIEQATKIEPNLDHNAYLRN